eukprot:CAMPEP_0176024106 /NCGR_PEP_ID=MMETSP0120_2-20121206/11774_1 /TAXON_ID=160619 /ORGANISM="Kryptoperidinium foliaceum, Strain CCMP 1326" /LENGTH=508 /DNA_ID=CAMNT_0017357281 /DNA_START=51 /DNA_END=1577 /DNA_ORIENTATION=+
MASANAVANCREVESAALLLAPPGGEKTATSEAPAPHSKLVPEVDLGEAPGIYTAVMVAAFGGLSVRLGRSGEHAKLHPIWPLLLCLPVFAVQVSSVLILRSGLPTGAQPYKPGDGHSEALLKLKLALVIIVFLTNFKVLLNSAAHLVFCVNPITWVEVDHFQMKDGKVMHHLPNSVRRWFSLPSTVPCALVSIVMRFVSAYIVCVDSVSIILSSATAQDAIFNSLGISFITELERVWWEFCKHSFRLSPLREHEFKLIDEPVWTAGGQLLTEGKTELAFPCAIQCLVRMTTWKCVGMQTSFLRVGFGSRRIQQIMSLLLLFAIYTRQLLVVLYAIDTNVLPAARDLCEELKLSQADGSTVLGRLWDLFGWLMLSNMDDELAYVAHHGDLQSRCDDGELARMKLSNIRPLAVKHWWEIVVFQAIMVGVLVLPSLAISLYGFVAPSMTKTDQAQEKEISDMDAQIAEIDGRLRAIEELMSVELRDVKDGLNELREEFSGLRNRRPEETW